MLEESRAMRTPNDLDQLWMPFTANRRFKQQPKMVHSASGMYFTAANGDRLLDGLAGLWCVNAGHDCQPIVEAIRAQAGTLDFCSIFSIGHPQAFELASRLALLAPDGIDRVFFSNSGSEAVDTALKVALAYHRAKGDGARQRLVGRERSYHGVGFGGLSVAGVGAHRKQFGLLLPGALHLPMTYDKRRNAFSQGQPEHGADLADALEQLVGIHDASTIAAVIVEPVSGAPGVIPPPKGYLKRLRELCTRHGILLIFDEVITGFGRLGANFASQYFDVTPDIICSAKALTNGSVPMGATLVGRHVHDALMTGPDGAPELMHGYTYSGHPLACAAALATLDVYRDQGLFARSAEMAPLWQDAIHALRGLPHVVDIRNLGLLGAIEIASAPGEPGGRAQAVFQHCFENGVLVRASGENIVLSPPLIITASEIAILFEAITKAIKSLP
ncbi:MAG: aspartate aminotransferase family protein [Bosea sp.]|jgi:beta-alanine--pyruvate transaminase|nr:aspartate aminotransferase family protein [Bosea sp. (in: a-proteobacteria)]